MSQYGAYTPINNVRNNFDAYLKSNGVEGFYVMSAEEQEKYYNLWEKESKGAGSGASSDYQFENIATANTKLDSAIEEDYRSAMGFEQSKAGEQTYKGQSVRPAYQFDFAAQADSSYVKQIDANAINHNDIKQKHLPVTPEKQSYTLEAMRSSLEIAEANIKQQDRKDGVISKGYNKVWKETFNYDTAKSNVSSVIERDKQTLQKLEAASSDPEKFKDIWAQEYGVEYNEENLEKFHEQKQVFSYVSSVKNKTDNYHDQLDGGIHDYEKAKKFARNGSVGRSTMARAGTKLENGLINSLADVYSGDFEKMKSHIEQSSEKHGEKSTLIKAGDKYKIVKMSDLDEKGNYRNNNNYNDYRPDETISSMSKDLLKNVDAAYEQVLDGKDYEDYEMDYESSFINAYGQNYANENGEGLSKAYMASQDAALGYARAAAVVAATALAPATLGASFAVAAGTSAAMSSAEYATNGIKGENGELLTKSEIKNGIVNAGVDGVLALGTGVVATKSTKFLADHTKRITQKMVGSHSILPNGLQSTLTGTSELGLGTNISGFAQTVASLEGTASSGAIKGATSTIADSGMSLALAENVSVGPNIDSTKVQRADSSRLIQNACSPKSLENNPPANFVAYNQEGSPIPNFAKFNKVVPSPSTKTYLSELPSQESSSKSNNLVEEPKEPIHIAKAEFGSLATGMKKINELFFNNVTNQG